MVPAAVVESTQAELTELRAELEQWRSDYKRLLNASEDLATTVARLREPVTLDSTRHQFEVFVDTLESRSAQGSARTALVDALTAHNKRILGETE